MDNLPGRNKIIFAIYAILIPLIIWLIAQGGVNFIGPQ